MTRPESYNGKNELIWTLGYTPNYHANGPRAPKASGSTGSISTLWTVPHSSLGPA